VRPLWKLYVAHALVHLSSGQGVTTITVKNVDVSPPIVPPGSNFTLTIACDSGEQPSTRLHMTKKTDCTTRAMP
jgi:hypothetical protein